MRKIASVILCIFISVTILTGCGESLEVTPLLEQESVIAVSSNQGSSDGQALPERQKVTDENLLRISNQFINEFSGISPFADIASIDKAWIARKYYTRSDIAFFDKAFYSKYKFDMFTRLKDIEKIAKQNINPDVSLDENDDFSSCDGTSRGNPLWIKEDQVFGWYGSGGFLDSFQAYPLETYEVSGRYHIKAVDLYLAYDQDYFVDTAPKGVVYASSTDGSSANKYIEVGTFTVNEKDNSFSYKITKDLSSLVQYWYILEPNNSNGFWLTAKQSANSISSEKINVSIDGELISLGVPPVFEEDKLLIPFYQFCAEYGRIAHEQIDNNKFSLSTIDGNAYCDIESILFDIGARMSYDEPSKTYQIYSRSRIDQNAKAVGSYLMELVQKKKAVVLYEPTITTGGKKEQYKVVSILGDGYLDIQDGKPVIVNALERPSNLGPLLISDAAKKNFDTGKYVFGYFLDSKNRIVTDPVVLSQLQTITIANWEYEVFRDGLNLMDDYLLFWEKPKHFAGAALLDKWNDCIKTAYDAIEFNKDAEPYLDFMESFAATVLAQTFSPHAGISKLLGKALSETIQSTLIGIAVDTGMNNVTGKVKPADLVYSTTITEHNIFLSQRERMKEIVKKTGDDYILSYQDACDFLQGYYQLNATMKTLYIACEVYKELIPESRKSIEGAMVNLGQNVIQDAVLDFAVVSRFNDYIDSEEICGLLSDIASGTIDSLSPDYNEDTVYKFLSDMYKDLKNEKMKLNYALYNNAPDSMSYEIVGY